jgi:hypothetical protein
MDSTVFAASAAVLGCLVGGAATIATAWITQRTQTRRHTLVAEIRKRETLYADSSARPAATSSGRWSGAGDGDA